ncbi:site-specific DNA-methyltransferase [Janibacter terrae]|uniref:site-specific DNA-methyltransferase n=1 Tax=Janibacter terrae TaxID=103817 RepID=UPI00380160AF
MSRLTDLLNKARQSDPALAADLEREIKHLTERRAFGLNFERHTPETVELPGRKVRRGDKVRILPPRGEARKAENDTLWRVTTITKDGAARVAELEVLSGEGSASASVDDLVVVAEFRDPIYPGLASTGKVERGGDKPFHTVINAENYHALQTLLFTHRGKIDAIYIDPPYNTGAKDWKYNNDYVDGDDHYRHSKWLAFMERRLKLARDLLNPEESILIVTIDEKEVHRLGLLLQQTFPEASHQMVSSQINPAASARAGSFGRVDEYIFFVRLGAAAAHRTALSKDWVSAKGRTHTGLPRWDMLRRSGGGARRQDSPGGFYPIYIDPNGPKVASVGRPLPAGVSVPEMIEGVVAVLPMRKDGTEGRWMWSVDEFQRRLSQGRVRITGSEERGFVVSILKDGEYAKILNGEFGEPHKVAPDGSLLFEKREGDSVLAIPGTQWRIPSHDATQYGSRLLRDSLLPGREFPFPKSLYAVEDTLRFFVHHKPDALILDFFSGSGTTAHAVMRLNKQDGGRRQCISVTNNEVSAQEQQGLVAQGLRPGDAGWEALGICDYTTKPRVLAAITGLTSEDDPIKGAYKFTDEFPMADGFEENVEFFTLTYESPGRVARNRDFARIAPLLWMAAGSVGRRIDEVPDGWDVADSYGVLVDLDQSGKFVHAVKEAEAVTHAFIVTDDERSYQAVADALPDRVECVRLYEAYLKNFEIQTARSAQ